MVEIVIPARSSRAVTSRVRALLITHLVFGSLCFAQSEGGASDPSRFLAPSTVPRFALVVGVQNYWYLDHVPNAKNDATAIAQSLSNVGFSVTTLLDPTTNELLQQVGQLKSRTGDLKKPVITVLYFAGHGFQNGEWNWVVPVNADKDNPTAASIPVSSFIYDLANHAAGLAVFLFDSCRTGAPIGTEQQIAAASNVMHIAASPTSPRAVVGLATLYGLPADSSETEHDPNSPFSSELSQLIPQSGISLSDMFGEVQLNVLGRTQNKQAPELVGGAVSTRFYFNPLDSQVKAARQNWEFILRAPTAFCLNRYLNAYPDSPYLQSALEFRDSQLNQLETGGPMQCQP